MESEAVLEGRRRRCAAFEQRWHAFVQRWRRVERDEPSRARRLVAKVLANGLPEPKHRARPDSSDGIRCAMAVVRESGAFDEDGYVEANRLATRRKDPLLHFVED